MLFTSQGRSVLGKTVPSVLCTANKFFKDYKFHSPYGLVLLQASGTYTEVIKLSLFSYLSLIKF